MAGSYPPGGVSVPYPRVEWLDLGNVVVQAFLHARLSVPYPRVEWLDLSWLAVNPLPHVFFQYPILGSNGWTAQTAAEAVA